MTTELTAETHHHAKNAILAHLKALTNHCQLDAPDTPDFDLILAHTKTALRACEDLFDLIHDNALHYCECEICGSTLAPPVWQHQREDYDLDRLCSSCQSTTGNHI